MKLSWRCWRCGFKSQVDPHAYVPGRRVRFEAAIGEKGETVAYDATARIYSCGTCGAPRTLGSVGVNPFIHEVRV